MRQRRGQSREANVATPPPVTTHYDDCPILREGPSPRVGTPADINLAQLSEIGLELAGMRPDQAHRFPCRMTASVTVE